MFYDTYYNNIHLIFYKLYFETLDNYNLKQDLYVHIPITFNNPPKVWFSNKKYTIKTKQTRHKL